MKKALKITLFITLSLFIVSICTFVYLFISVASYNLNENKLLTTPAHFEFYSYSGELIDEKRFSENVEYVNLNSLNPHTYNAFIAIEDRRFYSHNGIDLKRIIGASISNLKSLSFKEGASTITQQLVKNTHLTSEKTLKRKVAEIKITLQLEKKYSKNKILELYLNTIYFGKGAYGIESASKTYFNKSASNLTLSESATLAGIIKAPSNFQPYENYGACINRRNLVLKSMLKCGYITESEYNIEVKKEIILSREKASNVFDDYIKATYEEYESSKNFTPYNYNKVKIYTYLDPDLQRSIASYKSNEYGCQGIIINSKNNGVVAYFGNNSNLKRTPASCVKPWLIYAPIINDGFVNESTLIEDSPISINGYSPQNYNKVFNGKVTVKQSLKNSLNVSTVKIASDYGLDKIESYANKFNLSVISDGLPSTLGAINGGLTLKELCDNYSVFNDNGNYTTSSFIRCVYENGVKTYEHNPISKNIYTPETAFIVSDMLNSATIDGTSKKLRTLPFTVYAKTGTNGNEKGNLDAISVAYTSENVVGVWLYPKNEGLMPNTVTGSNQPTIISSKILTELYKNHKPAPIIAPLGVTKANIDLDILYKEQKEVINIEGEPFYYLDNKAPKLTVEEYCFPTIFNACELIKGNVITLNFNLKYTDKIEIFSEINGKTTLIYSGKPLTSFNYVAKENGVYNFTLKAYNGLKSTEFKFKPLKFTTSLNLIKNDNWLLD